MDSITTYNFKETQAIAAKLAQQILQQKPSTSAVVLALKGDLGAGKTTFLQGFAKGLGIKEKILSPTFILMKRFNVKHTTFKYFYHFDLYRLHSPNEVLHLGLKEIINNPENIVAVEWPEKIKKLLPVNTISIMFGHIGESKRKLTFYK